MAAPIIGTVMPSPVFYGVDTDGVTPLVGGLLYTYAAGTSTPLTTYANAALTVPNTNPVELNSAGFAVVFLSARTYKFTLTSATGTIIWTVDGVASTGLSQSIVGIGGMVQDFGGSEFSPIPTLYPAVASGAAYTACHADTTLWSVDSNLLVGTFALSGMLSSVTGVTTTAMLVNLTDAPDTAIVTISSTSSTGEIKTSGAITFATGGTAKTYGIKTNSAGTGFAWGLHLVRLT